MARTTSALLLFAAMLMSVADAFSFLPAHAALGALRKRSSVSRAQASGGDVLRPAACNRGSPGPARLLRMDAW